MKQILVELDDRCARELERVAPAKHRKRAEFIRRAIQQALDVALERDTQAAYRVTPMPGEPTAGDLEGWDPGNALARPSRRARRVKPARGAGS